MKTNFFSEMQALQSAGACTININFATDGLMVLSLLLSNNSVLKAGKRLPPMLIKGTAEELDNGFFDVVAEPVMQTLSMFQNLDAYQRDIEQAKQSLTSKPKSENQTPPSIKKADDSAELKKAFEEALKKVMDLNASCKYSEALEILPPNSAYPEKSAELDKLRRDLEWKNAQLSLL